MTKEQADAMRGLINAMKTSVKHGSTDHLDCSDDGGAFWYDAIETAEKVLKENDKKTSNST